MSKFTYLGIEWTETIVNKGVMNVTKRTDGFKEFEDIKVPDEILIWLNGETGPLQSSYITESQWWWDRGPDDANYVTWYFRDPSVALKFKLTWGSGVLQN